MLFRYFPLQQNYKLYYSAYLKPNTRKNNIHEKFFPDTLYVDTTIWYYVLYFCIDLE